MSDDRILEYLDTYGPASLDTISKDDKVPYSYDNIGKRLRLLSKTELINRIGQGTYEITDDGIGYLSGKYDMRDVERPD